MSDAGNLPLPASEPAPVPGRGRIVAARIVAIVADFAQIVAMPFFFSGAASPWNDMLDVAVAVVLIRLLGWHWQFLPAFLGELVPGLDLFPTWTAAVLLVTRGRPAPRAD